MTTITTKFGVGGANLAPNGSQGEPTLQETLRDIVDDLTELRAQLIATHVKLDADAGDTGGDNNYASTLVPDARTSIKG